MYVASVTFDLWEIEDTVQCVCRCACVHVCTQCECIRVCMNVHVCGKSV